MPVLSYFITIPLNESTIFLGTCKFPERNAFEERVQAWCDAYGYQYANVYTAHHYLGSIRQELGEM